MYIYMYLYIYICIYVSRDHNTACKQAFTPSKGPNIQSTVPSILTKKPYIPSKDPNVSLRASKESYTSHHQKSPILRQESPSKEPYILPKKQISSLARIPHPLIIHTTRKTALHSIKTALHFNRKAHFISRENTPHTRTYAVLRSLLCTFELTQKSPTFHQKSPIFYLKSPIFYHKNRFHRL